MFKSISNFLCFINSKNQSRYNWLWLNANSLQLQIPAKISIFMNILN